MRGILVLAAAVIVGILLLWKAGSGGGGTTKVDASKGSSNPGTTAPLGETTTTNGGSGGTTTTTGGTTAHKPADVAVLVLNGSGKPGVAASTSATIGEKGYKMGSPGNISSATHPATTSVYYAAGYQAEAEAIASVLGKDSSIVQAKPSTAIGPGSDSANVVVVLGLDTPAASTSGSTTSTTAGSSGSTTSTTSG